MPRRGLRLGIVLLLLPSAWSAAAASVVAAPALFGLGAAQVILTGAADVLRATTGIPTEL